MEMIVRMQRGDVSEAPQDRSRAWARHELEFVVNNWGHQQDAINGLGAQLQTNTFQIYVVAEVDAKLAEMKAAFETADTGLKEGLLGAISELPARIFPEDKKQEVVQAVLSALQDQLAQRDERMRAELKEELLKELRAALAAQPG